jgi:hypothetical protein
VVSEKGSEKRRAEMMKAWLYGGTSLLVICGALAGTIVVSFALEEGDVTGRIERTNHEFLRDYEKIDYRGNKDWQQWGKGLRSLGWIVVRGDSGELRDYLLLVIDTRTQVENKDTGEGRLLGLGPGDRIWAKYRMGYDALHALEVKKLDE